MSSAYDADRIFGILTRLRACLGIVVGILLLAMCGTVSSVEAPRSTSHLVSVTRPDGSPGTAEDLAAAQASFDSMPGQARPSSPLPMLLFALALLVFGITALEFAIGSWIGNGERSGFLWGAWVEGISCLFGLFNLGGSPLAIVGFLLSLAMCVYCVARLTGMGPKPI